MRQITILLAIFILSSCSAVTVRTDSERKSQNPPNFEKRYNYYFWGFKGEHKVNVRMVCKGKDIEQIQSIHTFRDNLLALITLGIYSPRTARIWCEEN
jgi:predicted RND superfamily exporter protein